MPFLEAGSISIFFTTEIADRRLFNCQIFEKDYHIMKIQLREQ